MTQAQLELDASLFDAAAELRAADLPSLAEAVDIARERVLSNPPPPASGVRLKEEFTQLPLPLGLVAT